MGKNGPEVPRLGLGMMGSGAPVWGPPPSDEERLALLDKAYELGETFWDTGMFDSIGTTHAISLSGNNGTRETER